MNLWAPPAARGPLAASITIPGSKSHTNRALVLALLAQEPTRITGALEARDTDLMVAAIREFGARVDVAGTTITVDPPRTLAPATGRLDCGLAGTVMRFLAPVAALAQGDTRFDGDPGARVRPMAGLLNALADLGVQIDYHGREGFLPFTIHGRGRLAGGDVMLDAGASSQYLSALLLAAPRFESGLNVGVTSAPPSSPHINMTLKALTHRGATANVSVVGAADSDGACHPVRWHVQPGPLRGGEVQIAPDLTNAGPFLTAALIAGGYVRIMNWPAHSAQPGAQWRNLLTALGGRVTRDGNHLVAQGAGPLTGIDWDMADVGELVPTVAAAAALAITPSTLRNVAHLRGHETDRLRAISDSLRALGGDAKAGLTSIKIRPRPLVGARLSSFADHRMVMFAALLALRVEGITVADPLAVAKTYPGFIDQWQAMVDGECG